MSNNGEENGNAWSCVRNNGNNAWYVNLGNGYCNNTNPGSRLGVWPVSEFDIIEQWLEAERECYKNKHSSFEAAMYHYHLSEIYKLIERIQTGYKPTTSICFVLDYPVKTSIADAAAFIDIHNGKNRYIRKIKNRRKKRNINSSIQKDYEIWEINQ